MIGGQQTDYYYHFRQQKAANPRHHVTNFSLKTGSGTMRSHLSHQHTHDWILTCDANDIKITATGVQEILVEYRSSQGEEHTDSANKSRKPYSREAFVDALVEFIVADDQVSKIDCNVHDVDKSFHFNTRQLMLLSVENSETYC